MQTMPALFRNQRRTLVGHRVILNRNGKMSILGSRNLCARQVRQAIFFPITSDAELEIRIAQLGCATNRALVQRFGLTAGIIIITFSRVSDFVSVMWLVTKLWSIVNNEIRTR